MQENAVPANLQLLALFLALNLADVVMTHVNISLGLSIEANPLIRMVIEHFGWTALYGFKVIGPILLSGAILPNRAIMQSRWFSGFLCLLCLISLAGVCSGIAVIGWHLA